MMRPGLIVNPRWRQPESLANEPKVGAAAPSGEITRQASWIDYALPSRNQGNDLTCGPTATIAMVTAMYQAAGQRIPADMVIGVRPFIRAMVREMGYALPFQGSTMTDCFQASFVCGLIPKQARMFRPQTREQEWSHMTANGPLVDGCKITRGWDRVDRDNGYMDPTVGLDDWGGGHAVCRMAMQGAGDHDWLIRQDSQGPRHGNHGFHTIHRTAHLLTQWGDTWGIVLPEGAAAQYDGWRKLLVRVEDNGPVKDNERL